jgi:hypothetical protein
MAGYQNDDVNSSAPAGVRPRNARLLALSACVIAALLTGASTAPAHADPMGDTFLAALTNAGVNYTDPDGTVALGQSVCPMLAQPGGSFASVASSMAGNNGISQPMAGQFTSLAIAMFCPSMMTSLAGGNIPPIPGMQIPV